MTDDRWRCPCGYTHPVATMVTDHKARCEVWEWATRAEQTDTDATK